MKRILSFLKQYYLVVLFLSFIFLMCTIYIPEVIGNFKEVYKPSAKSNTYIEEYKDNIEEAGYKVTPSSTSSNPIAKALRIRSKLTEAMMGEVDYLKIDDFMLSANAWFCRNVGMKYIPGTSFIKLDNGTLTSVSDSILDTNTAYNEITLLKTFSDAISEKGIPTLYVNCPYKTSILNPCLPDYLTNNPDDNFNGYIRNILNDFMIDNIDITEEMKKDDINLTEIFYKTDHHWRSEYGIYTAQQIAETLNEKYGYNLDTSVYSKENYTEKVYEDALLGSTGINSTLAFTEAEDLIIRYPKAEDNYKFSIPTKNVNASGSFDVMIDHTKLDNTACWPFNAYASFIYANSAFINIQNESITDNHNILIIKDSFANVVIPYMSQTIGNIDVVDLRSSQEDYYQDSVLKLIDDNNYDMVIFICSSPSEFNRLFLESK